MAELAAGSEVPLPPNSRYLGSRITIERTGGGTATGSLIAVTEEAIELRLDDGTVTVAPYATTTSARLEKQETTEAGPMTPERLAEIRDRAESVKTWKGYHAEPVPQLLDVDVPALLAEVERLRAERDKRCSCDGALDWIDQLAGERNQAEADVSRAEAERDRLADQVKRVRALDLHQGSAHFPDECRQGCPGCAVATALDGTEAGQ